MRPAMGSGSFECECVCCRKGGRSGLRKKVRQSCGCLMEWKLEFVKWEGGRYERIHRPSGFDKSSVGNFVLVDADGKNLGLNSSETPSLTGQANAVL